MLVLVALFMMIFADEGGFITGIFLLTFTGFRFIVSMVASVITLKKILLDLQEEHISRKMGLFMKG
jgi:hypothetical protein